MIPHLPRGLTTHKYNVKRFPLKYWLHYSLTQVRIAESINYLDKYLRINLVREINALLSWKMLTIELIAIVKEGYIVLRNLEIENILKIAK